MSFLAMHGQCWIGLDIALVRSQNDETKRQSLGGLFGLVPLISHSRGHVPGTDPQILPNCQMSNVKYQHELLSTHRCTRVSSLQQRPWLNRPPAFRLHDMDSYIDPRHSARYELTCHRAPSIHVCRFNLSEFSPAKKDGQFQPLPFRWHFRILSLPRCLLSEWEDPFGSRQPAQGARLRRAR